MVSEKMSFTDDGRPLHDNNSVDDGLTYLTYAVSAASTEVTK